MAFGWRREYPKKDTGSDLPETAYSYLRRVRWRSERFQRWLGVTLVLLVAFGLFGRTHKGRNTSLDHPQRHDTSSASITSPLKHLLITASRPSQDLCKLLLTTSTLGYPHPRLLSWNQTIEKELRTKNVGMLIENVRQTADYLKRFSSTQHDELVLVVHGDDVLFQLPPEIIAARYYEIMEQSNARFAQHYGPQAMRHVRYKGLDHAISNRVIFGAAKQCSPNRPQTLACYPIPESPLPNDLYGPNTDTPIGWSTEYSYRQRYLASGFVIGPVKEMMRLYKRTADDTKGWQDFWLARNFKPDQTRDPVESVEGESELFYHGSAQSVFAKIFGRQEYVREVLRRRFEPDAGGENDLKKSGNVQGIPVDDVLDPPFKHERWGQVGYWDNREGEETLDHRRDLELVPHHDLVKADPDELLDRYDFGITLDYFSDLGHQKLDSERDAAWIVHGEDPSASQDVREDRGSYDCPPPLDLQAHRSFPGTKRVPPLPNDIGKSTHPEQRLPNRDSYVQSPHQSLWLSTPLYTHLCLSTRKHSRIPAIIHSNSDQDRREEDWEKLSWLYNVAKPVLEAEEEHFYDGAKTLHDARSREGLASGFRDRNAPGAGGAWAGNGFPLSWNQVCPRSLLEEARIFGHD